MLSSIRINPKGSKLCWCESRGWMKYQLKQSWICKEKHLHWEEDWTGAVIGKGAGVRSLKWNDRIHCFLLRNKPKQFTKCFNLDKEKLFILNRFRAAGVCDLAEIAPFWGCISPTVCSLLHSPTSDLWSRVGCAATLKHNEGIYSMLSSATHLFFSLSFLKLCSQ